MQVDRVMIPHIDNIMADAHTGAAWGRHNGRLIFRCQCGRVFTLGKHTVSDNGDVSPSMYDPICGYHVWGHLIYWTFLVDGWAADHPNSPLRPR